MSRTLLEMVQIWYEIKNSQKPQKPQKPKNPPQKPQKPQKPTTQWVFGQKVGF